MSFRLPNGLIDFFSRHVPSEARSAFVVRAAVREVEMQKYKAFTETEPECGEIEAFARGWLTCSLYSASQDPRKDFDADDADAFVEETVSRNCQAAWQGNADKGILPIEVGGRQLIRRARAVGAYESIPGSTPFSVRWPAWMTEYFANEVSGNRSALVERAVKREFLICHDTAVDATRSANVLVERVSSAYRMFWNCLGSSAWSPGGHSSNTVSMVTPSRRPGPCPPSRAAGSLL